jgi:CHRD domain
MRPANVRELIEDTPAIQERQERVVTAEMRTRGRIAGAAAMTALFTAGVWIGLGSAGQAVGAAANLSLTAKLNASQEVPKPKAGAAARGTFAAGLVRNGGGGSMAWRLTFQGLSGKASAAHVHLGKRGKAGAVAVSLCGPCRSGMRGTAKLNAKTVTALLAGGAYVNVHTAKNPMGEIRGQVARSAAAPPPPPATTTGGGSTTDVITYEPYP